MATLEIIISQKNFNIARDLISHRGPNWGETKYIKNLISKYILGIEDYQLSILVVVQTNHTNFKIYH